MRMIRSRLDRFGLGVLWDVFLFMAITVVFHLIYKNFIGLVSGSDVYRIPNEFMTQHIYYVVAWINERLFADSVILIDEFRTIRFILGYEPYPVFNEMYITRGCSGLKQMYQAFFLFLLYPGPTRHRFWYIPMAAVVMQITNILRLVVLSFTMKYIFQHWDFVHDWVARPLFYLVLFGLWVIWNEHIVPREKASRQ